MDTKRVVARQLVSSHPAKVSEPLLLVLVVCDVLIPNGAGWLDGCRAMSTTALGLLRYFCFKWSTSCNVDLFLVKAPLASAGEWAVECLVLCRWSMDVCARE